MHEMLPLQITQYQHQEELYLIVNTAEQLKHHFFLYRISLSSPYQIKLHKSLPLHLIEIYGAQLAKAYFFYLW